MELMTVMFAVLGSFTVGLFIGNMRDNREVDKS